MVVGRGLGGKNVAIQNNIMFSNIQYESVIEVCYATLCLSWRILSITLLACEMSAIVW